MLDDIRDIAEFYNSNPDGEHDRFSTSVFVASISIRARSLETAVTSEDAPWTR